MNRADRFDSLIAFHADIQGIPFDRAKRQMLAESNADPQARSASGAIGLFQLMPATAMELRVDPSDIEGNVKGGLAYMAMKLREVPHFLGSYHAYEDDIYRMALASYNAGAGYVMLAIQALRKSGKPADWENFIAALATVRLNGKRPDWRQVDGYIHKILPPPPIA